MYVITEFYENSAVILVPELPTVVIRFSATAANASQQLHSLIKLFGLRERFILLKVLHPTSYDSN
jgi:ABC-type nitrate/sulfonate/bicarbonate transport system permease component